MDAREKNKIITEFNNTTKAYPKDKTIIELFEEQVEKTPDKVAVVFEEKQLTYKELNMKANALAYKLRELSVKTNDYVAIIAERSIEMIIGIYGTIKAGGAYVPIDPISPLERIQYMLEDCNPKVVLTYQSEVDTGMRVINLGEQEEWKGINENPVHVNKAEDLIYCIYTSGTTGKPKGVMIEHCSTVNLIKNLIHLVYENSCTQKVLSIAPYSFDMSIKSKHTLHVR